MWHVLVLCVFLLLLYVIYKKFNYWRSRGVPGPTPLPFIGNMGVSMIGMRHISEIYADIYRKYEEYPFVGIYRMGQPCLMLRDPELIKKVLIKDFTYFMENDFFVDKNIDPLVGRNIFALNGEEWKKGRQFLSPNFAGLKLKAVFPLVESVGNRLVTYVEKHGEEALDAKHFFTKYACDVVALCGFGIEGNSFEDPDAIIINLFRKFSTPDFSFQGIKLILALLLPKLMNIKLVPKEFDEGVIALTNETLKYRKENNIVRNDFFDVATASTSISPIEISAHTANFILDGSESSPTAMTFVIYDIANNPECQEKLRKEINTILEKYNGEFSYEAMQEMVYLDACVNETLRLNPPSGQLGKTCTKPYTMTSSGNEYRNLSVTIEKGTSILIPLLGLQRDPKHFSSPDKYMPERFLNKEDSYRNVYMPFGSGPRMCVGLRFGLMQVKVGIVHMIKNFEVTLDKKTIHPLQYEPIYFSLYPKGGVWIRCKKLELRK